MFAGSMQLLAGVKLCTGRTLTNHPHYEDNSLRERTKAVRAPPAFPPPVAYTGKSGLRALELVAAESRLCPAPRPLEASISVPLG